MLIEIYKGIEIFHNAAKDEFYTNVVVNKRSGKPDEVIKGGRLGAVHEILDKWLNTAAKKPIVKLAWYKGKYEYDPYEKVEVLIFNAITSSAMIKGKDGRLKEVSISPDRYRDERIFLSCKENDAIIANLNKKREEIEKIKRETSCSSGKLIPCKPEHFL